MDKRVNRKENSYRYPPYVNVNIIKDEKIALSGYLKLIFSILFSTIIFSGVLNYELFIDINGLSSWLLAIKNSLKDYLYSSLFLSVVSFIMYLILVAFKKKK